MTKSVDVILESECTDADIAAVTAVFEDASIRANVRGDTFANQRLIFPDLSSSSSACGLPEHS